MATTLLLDTCILPQSGDIRSYPLLSAVIRIARLRGVRIAISDITRAESINRRRSDAQEALTKLQSALKGAAKLYDPGTLSFYIPGVDDAVDAWTRELDGSFAVVGSHGDDAIEALLREAHRIAPAKWTDAGSATGGRDAAIWLTAKRLADKSSDSIVYFISSNTKDFADRASKTDLREELAGDQSSVRGQLHYMTSLESTIAMMAEPAIELTDPIRVSRVTQSPGEIDRTILDLIQGHAGEPGQGLWPVSVSTTTAPERNAYQVDEVRLSQHEIPFVSNCVDWSESGDSTTEVERTGTAFTWIYDDGETASFEVYRISFGGVSFRPD